MRRDASDLVVADWLVASLFLQANVLLVKLQRIFLVLMQLALQFTHLGFQICNLAEKTFYSLFRVLLRVESRSLFLDNRFQITYLLLQVFDRGFFLSQLIVHRIESLFVAL